MRQSGFRRSVETVRTLRSGPLCHAINQGHTQPRRAHRLALGDCPDCAKNFVCRGIFQQVATCAGANSLPKGARIFVHIEQHNFDRRALLVFAVAEAVVLKNRQAVCQNDSAAGRDDVANGRFRRRLYADNANTGFFAKKARQGFANKTIFGQQVYIGGLHCGLGASSH